MKFILFAYNEIGYACMEELIKQGKEILSLVTHDHDKNSALMTPETLAVRHNIPCIKVNSAKDLIGLEKKLPKESDFLLSAYFKYIIPDTILAFPRYAALNIHGSYLPYYRGRCPVNWAILNGESETGVTLHHMVSRVDAGDIVDQEKIPIALEDNAGDVTQKMALVVKVMLNRHLPLWKQGIIHRKPHDISFGSYFGGRTPKDSEINWTQSSWQIYNLIRAMHPSPPYPAAWSDKCLKKDGRLIQKKIMFYEADSPSQTIFPSTSPGTLFFDDNFYLVACGKKGEERLKVLLLDLASD